MGKDKAMNNVLMDPVGTGGGQFMPSTGRTTRNRSNAAPLAPAARDLCGRPDARLLDFLAPPLDAALGTWSLCPLGEQGILILHANRPQALAPRFLAQLRAVLEKLTTAIQGSLAFTLTEPPLSGTIPLQKALPAFGSECATAAPAP